MRTAGPRCGSPSPSEFPKLAPAPLIAAPRVALNRGAGPGELPSVPPSESQLLGPSQRKNSNYPGLGVSLRLSESYESLAQLEWLPGLPSSAAAAASPPLPIMMLPEDTTDPVPGPVACNSSTFPIENVKIRRTITPGCLFGSDWSNPFCSGLYPRLLSPPPPPPSPPPPSPTPPPSTRSPVDHPDPLESLPCIRVPRSRPPPWPVAARCQHNPRTRLPTPPPEPAAINLLLIGGTRDRWLRQCSANDPSHWRRLPSAGG